MKGDPKVLMVCTRDFSMGDNGRNKVLSTYLQCISTVGKVDVLVFDEIADEKKFRLKFPYVGRLGHSKNGMLSVLVAVILSLLKNRSINSGFFSNNSAATSLLREWINKNNYEIVYVDTVRLFDVVSLSNVQGTKTLLDMDDLYSKRYEQASGNNYDVLGYWANRLPGYLVKIGNGIARLLLQRESRLLEFEEVNAAKAVDYVTLVSKAEAQYLSKRASIHAFDFPMSINLSEYSWKPRVPKQPVSMVFVGSPKLPQNKLTLDVICEFCEINKDAAFTITVVGDVTGFVTSCYDKRILFAGFVDDLYKYLSGFDCFFAPIFFGTGVKTKLLEAAAVGLPIITTFKGVEGTELSSSCFIFDNIKDIDLLKITNFVAERKDDDIKAQQKYIEQHFGYESCVNRIKVIFNLE